MAVRGLRTDDDEILKKRSREVEDMDERITELISDMKETMYSHEGVGLAAPQIGVLKRIIIIDVGDGPVVIINPVIQSSSGKKTEIEGCLSVTKYIAKVERPAKVKVTGYDEKFRAVSYDTKDLFARAVCHETDHLDGVLMIDKAVEVIEKKDY